MLSSAAVNQSLVLKRPFAKLRFVTTDWKVDGLTMPDNFKVTYKNCTRFTNINALTGGSSESTLPDPGTTTYTAAIDKDNKDYTLGYDASDKNRTLIVDYLMTENSSNQTPIHFVFETLDGTNSVSTYDFTTNVPIRRNYLTTILGDLLSVGANFEVSCNEVFEDEYNDYYTEAQFYPTAPAYDATTNTYTITDANELAWISANTDEVKSKNRVTILLANDIDLKGINWTPINIWNPENPPTLDGNGMTIYNLRIDANGKRETGFIGASTIKIKDLTIENATINNVANHTGALAGNLYGEVTNCTVKHIFIRVSGYDAGNPVVINAGGLIGLHNSGKLENCTAFDVNIKSYHGAGGLVGKIVEGDGGAVSKNRDYINCHVENSTMWASASSGRGMKQVGAIFGLACQVMTLTDCTEANNVYKVKPYGDDYFITFTSADIENDRVSDYGPTNKLYGFGEQTVTIVDTTTTP